MSRIIYILLFLPCFVFANSPSEGDSTKQKGTEYPLSDPRNPNCPCHKSQKLAEEEFQQQEVNAKNIDFDQLGNIDRGNIQIQPLPILQERGNSDNANVEQGQARQTGTFNLNQREERVRYIESSSDYSGSYHKSKNIQWRKYGFKAKKKIQRFCCRTKKIKTNYSVCFKW